MGLIWTALGSYDEKDVERFLARAVPLTIAAQRQSVSVTDAYLARFLGKRAIGVSPRGVKVRNGVTPQEAYRRPFVTVWTALDEGTQWADAVKAGGARAEGMIAFDVQSAMRATLAAV